MLEILFSQSASITLLSNCLIGVVSGQSFKMESSSREQKSTFNGFRNNFDAFNWIYWSIWWQQFYYWRSYLSQVNDNQGSSPPSVPPHNLQHNGPAGEQPLMEPGRGPQIRVEFRVFNGFETYIASIWCRIIAEVIDTALVCALLKWYIPELDFR